MGSGTRLEWTLAGGPEHCGCSMDDYAPERGRRLRGVCFREGCNSSLKGATTAPPPQPQRIDGRHRRNFAGQLCSSSSSMSDWKENFRATALVLLVLLIGSKAIGMTGNTSRPLREHGDSGSVLAGVVSRESGKSKGLLPLPGKMNALQPRDLALQQRHRPGQHNLHHHAAWMVGGLDNLIKSNARVVGLGKHREVARDNVASRAAIHAKFHFSELGLAGLATSAMVLALQMTVPPLPKLTN